jgi:hypothetical protein
MSHFLFHHSQVEFLILDKSRWRERKINNSRTDLASFINIFQFFSNVNIEFRPKICTKTQTLHILN